MPVSRGRRWGTEGLSIVYLPGIGLVIGILLELLRPRLQAPGVLLACLMPLVTIVVSLPLLGVGVMSATVMILQLFIERKWWRPVLAFPAAAAAASLVARLSFTPEGWRDGQAGIAVMAIWIALIGPMLLGMYGTKLLNDRRRRNDALRDKI